MKWPWVSRLAFDLALQQLLRTEKQVDALQDALLRVSRKQAGMGEQPRRGQEAPAQEDLPPEVVALIRGFDSEAIQAAVEDDVRRARKAGTPWTEIVRLLETDGEEVPR
jgi:hypothetical protein